MYKLFIYLLLNNGFSILSTQTVEEIGASVIHHKKSYFKHHKMGRFKLESYFLDNKNKFKVRRSDTCVIDYIWSQFRGKRGFKTYDYDKLYEELVEFADIPPFMDTDELINWIKACHSNISLHAYTCTYKQFISHIANRPDIELSFIVKDNHLHPITDSDKKMWPCVVTNKELKIYSNICQKLHGQDDMIKLPWTMILKMIQKIV